MFLGKYSVTSHAVEQYEDRVKNKLYPNVYKCIKNDLRTLNIRNIITIGDECHIFTKGSKEFVFSVKDTGLSKSYVLKTVIKRNVEDTRKTIEKRKAEAAKYDKRMSKAN